MGTTAVILRNSATVVVPMSGVAPVGPKGDPGGNIGSIGLFEDAHSLTIPSGTDVVRTAGYAIVGKGIADYFADLAVDAAYVSAHPRTSFISANSRGFRLDTSKGIDLFQVGGVADCSSPGVGTDNYPAILAATTALGRGGTLIVPDGGNYFFRSSQTPKFTSGISVVGHGWHQNPGIVNGVSYSGYSFYSGSIICFDANVAGFQFIAATDHNADDIAYQYQSSVYSRLENVMLLGGGGNGTSAHGIEIRACLFGNNVWVTGFAGNGVLFNSYNPGYSGQPYGNADESSLRSFHSTSNSLHGFAVHGTDANVISFWGCNASTNGGVGYFDPSFLGNNYYGCHAAANNQSHPSTNGSAYSSAQRAYVTSASGNVQTQTGWPSLADQLAGSFVSTSQVGAHTFDGCYAEPGVGAKTGLIRPSVVLGGNIASTENIVDSVYNFQPFKLNGGQLLNVEEIHSAQPGGGVNFNDIIKINGLQVLAPRQPFPGYPTGGSVIDNEARYAISQLWALAFTHGLAG